MNINDMRNYTDRLIELVLQEKHSEVAAQADKMIKFLRLLYKRQDALARKQP